MAIRLNKVTRDLNVGITTVVEFLQKKGYAIEASPNAKITEEQYAELVKEFSTDKNLKKETEKLIQERQTKDKTKTVSVPANQEAESEEQEMDLRTGIKIKPLGKIDLDSLNKKTVATNEEKPKNEELSVKKNNDTEKITEEKQEPKETVSLENIEPQEMQMEKQNPETKNMEEGDDVFKIRPTELKTAINVLGKIDLDALNQSTRPKKKTKEEKKKERDEKEKQRQQQRRDEWRKQMGYPGY